MTQHRLLALAAACLAALLTTAPAAAAAPVDPPQLVLRPSDLSGGYSIEACAGSSARCASAR